MHVYEWRFRFLLPLHPFFPRLLSDLGTRIASQGVTAAAAAAATALAERIQNSLLPGSICVLRFPSREERQHEIS